jgi:diaminopimelate decarboxylase
MITIDSDQLKNLSHQFGLPLHVIFLEEVERNATGFFRVAGALYPKMLIAFAVKSNPCRGAVRLAAKLGLGVDVASEYELQASLEEGILPEKTVCNGNAKSDRYLEMCVEGRCLVAVDNAYELQLLNKIGARIGLKARVLIRLAGMPLEGFTSVSQSTAGSWTKFGFPLENAIDALHLVQDHPHIAFHGFSAHIGTQICDPRGYDRLLDLLLDLGTTAIDLGLNLTYLDIGGGFPVAFVPDDKWKDFTSRLREQLGGRLPPEESVTWGNLPMGYKYLQGRVPEERDPWVGKAYWSPFVGPEMLDRVLARKTADGVTVSEKLRNMGSPTLIVEPGRSLFGPAGITVAQVLGTKDVMDNRLIILDMGINNHGTNLLSPDVFSVEVVPAGEDDRSVEAFLAGRLCFSGDMISMAKVEMNRLPQRGELVVIHGTGAYSADHFASNSCGFPRPAKVAIRKRGAIEVWRDRERFANVFPPLRTT